MRLEDRLKFRSWNVPPFVGVVLEGLDGLGGGLFGHDYFFPVADCAVADASILLNSLSTLALKSASI
jgi:hypothetical protein